jgi:protein-disulfide isomerase
MTISRALIATVLVAALSAVGNAAVDDDKATVVAEVNGQKLTRADLEQKQVAKLLQARYQQYLAEREALDQLIDQQLLEMQAAREHLTVAELVDREVISRAKEPTDDQIELFYEGMRTEESLAAVRDKIVATIRQIRTSKARAMYVQSLRSQAKIRIALGPPDTQVLGISTPNQDRKNVAAVVVVEFADYECPYCRTVHPEIKKLQEEFGDKVSVIFRDFPLPMHANAAKAAEAARCAGAQGKFWDYHDLLFTSTKKPEVAQLKENARTLGLETQRFDQCLDSNEQAAAVRKDLAEAQRLGLDGTPSFFINGRFLSGAVKYNTLREIVEQQLGEPQSAEKTIVSK